MRKEKKKNEVATKKNKKKKATMGNNRYNSKKVMDTLVAKLFSVLTGMK